MPAVLVIEGNKFQRRSLCRLVRAAGAERVVEAADIRAAHAVLAARRWPAWLVVADPDLLGPDAMAALLQLSADHPVATTLLLTHRRAAALEALREQARQLRLPILAVLRKPVSAEEAGSLLRRLVQSAATSSVAAKPSPLTKDELSECLRAGRLRARFQPKLDLESGRPVSCEALAYVIHARYGDVPAARFSQAMTQLGAQRVMTASVLRDAAGLVRALRGRALGAKVAVNLVPDVLSEPGDASSLDSYVRTLGIAPSDLALEIGTSRHALASPAFADNLARLKLRGYSLAIDDVPGSLEWDNPAHAHFSEIKLDWEALSRQCAEADSGSIAAAVKSARKHGMATCAVGVQTNADLDQARRAGIELGQGELFAPSLPAEETLTWVEREERIRSFAHKEPKHQCMG